MRKANASDKPLRGGNLCSFRSDEVEAVGDEGIKFGLSIGILVLNGKIDEALGREREWHS